MFMGSDGFPLWDCMRFLMDFFKDDVHLVLFMQFCSQKSGMIIRDHQRSSNCQSQPPGICMEIDNDTMQSSGIWCDCLWDSMGILWKLGEIGIVYGILSGFVTWFYGISYGIWWDLFIIFLQFHGSSLMFWQLSGGWDWQLLDLWWSLMIIPLFWLQNCIKRTRWTSSFGPHLQVAYN